MRRKKKNVEGKIKNATVNYYDDIKFRSILEKNCYIALKENNLNPEYEKNKYTLVEAFIYDNEKVRPITYTPDFEGENYIIECKGFANDVFPLKWKMFKNYLLNNKITKKLFLVKNKKELNETVEKIKNINNNFVDFNKL